MAASWVLLYMGTSGLAALRATFFFCGFWLAFGRLERVSTFFFGRPSAAQQEAAYRGCRTSCPRTGATAGISTPITESPGALQGARRLCDGGRNTSCRTCTRARRPATPVCCLLLSCTRAAKKKGTNSFKPTKSKPKPAKEKSSPECS